MHCTSSPVRAPRVVRATAAPRTLARAGATESGAVDSKRALRRLSKSDLAAAAAARGISTTGNKAKLVHRLLAGSGGAAAAPAPVLPSLAVYAPCPSSEPSPAPILSPRDRAAVADLHAEAAALDVTLTSLAARKTAATAAQRAQCDAAAAVAAALERVEAGRAELAARIAAEREAAEAEAQLADGALSALAAAKAGLARRVAAAKEAAAARRVEIADLRRQLAEFDEVDEVVSTDVEDAGTPALAGLAALVALPPPTVVPRAGAGRGVAVVAAAVAAAAAASEEASTVVPAEQEKQEEEGSPAAPIIEAVAVPAPGAGLVAARTTTTTMAPRVPFLKRHAAPGLIAATAAIAAGKAWRGARSAFPAGKARAAFDVATVAAAAVVAFLA